jgi:CRISPR/Cas system-associated endoribonuclease Cas2
MEENKIHLINQIDLSKIIYSKVNEMNDKKLIHIYYEKPGQKLLFQTPQLLNIFDIQKNQYFNELILPLYDCNLKVPLLIQFFKDLDSKIIDAAKDNKNEWFKNKQAIRYKSTIKNLYTSQSQTNYYTPTKDDEKYSKNGLIKLKLTNGIKILENNNEIKLEDLKKNNNLRLIVELYGIWVSNEVFGIYLKPVMIEQIQNKVINFIDEKEDITEINFLETDANSEDEYIDKDELRLVPRSSNKTIKSETSEEEDIDLNIDNTKMYQFGLHDINDDLFNTLKKDKKIATILSELNSNNTKKDISLSEMSSDVNDELLNIKEKYNEDEDDEDDEDDDSDDDTNVEDSDNSDTSPNISEIKINRR